IGHVPERSDDRGRSRVPECARQTNQPVTADLAGSGTAGTQEHEVGVKIQPVDLLSCKPAVFPGMVAICAERQVRIERLVVTDDAMSSQVNASVLSGEL